jgi:perosamine synthetase
VKPPDSSKGWRFSGNELLYVKEVLESGFAGATTGSMNQRLERAFAERFGVTYSITSNSGTSTLHQALAAFGVVKGDEVILPALSPVMCGYAVLHAGATPVFADIDAETFLMDPNSVAANISPRTKAIMAVHLYGLPCNMDAIMGIAAEHDLYVLEDCAQCFLGKDDKGRLGGTIGHAGSWSFENSKHMSTGDGGLLATNDDVLAERMRKFGGIGFKNIGASSGRVRRSKDVFQDPKYLRHDAYGWNYRLPEVAAAVGLAQLERLELFVSKRQSMAARYLDAIGDCKWLKPQKIPKGYVNSYYTFAVKYEGEQVTGASWYDFRKKHIEYGGDGIYSAWALIYNEPSMRLLNDEGRYFQDIPASGESYKGFLDGVHCPVAEQVQPVLLQFTTNQVTEEQMDVQHDALRRAIAYWGK